MRVRRSRYEILITGICLLVGMVFLHSCSKEALFSPLNSARMELIGRRVNFDASISQQFETKASDASFTGEFNNGDMLTIYRQYWLPEDNAYGEEEYRKYHLVQKYATGTSFSVGDPNWLPWAGLKGGRWTGTSTEQFIQADSDSLTWENDRIVRFRAVGRSNYAGCLTGGAGTYYPDFTISDWVTVSGPTVEIPFVMKHLGSRICFSPKESGNQLVAAQICTDASDYRWVDNSTDSDHDAADMFPDEGPGMTAQQAADNVKAAYERMCMPASVDMETGMLQAMTVDLFNSAAAEKKLHELGDDREGILDIGVYTPGEIASTAKRPAFTDRMWGEHLFMVTIPYDMSNSDTKGEPIVLPPYTRFKIWLYDVNGGDEFNTPGREGRYHIFSLSDVATEENGLKNGLEFSAGKSYEFRVGYKYGALTIELADSFAWVDENLGEREGVDISTDPSEGSQPYKWWQDAISTAAQSAMETSGDFSPQFTIADENQFYEFIKLVDGTAAKKMSDLYQAKRKIHDADGKVVSEDYWWYTGINAQGDTLWTTSEEMSKEGYVFYKQYYRSVGDIHAEVRETYLKGPYSFYDSGLNRHFDVKLAADLDLSDWKLPSIGEPGSSTFMGYFDGQNHTLKDVYMENEYLFGSIEGAAIRNLSLTSEHKLALVDKAEGANFIVGISLDADCTLSSIANEIIGVDADGRQNVSYVVGCIHLGSSGKGMIGKADNLYMYGCMETASGIAPGTGALLGEYYETANRFLDPQRGARAEWGRFLCNYYDTQMSPGTNAAGTVAVSYKAQEYIRGAKTHVLKATTDYMLPDNLPYGKLDPVQKSEIYGLAPWKAMNYGIFRYNNTTIGLSHPCTRHYVNDGVGYANRYPWLASDAPVAGQYANVLDQNN